MKNKITLYLICCLLLLSACQPRQGSGNAADADTTKQDSNTTHIDTTVQPAYVAETYDDLSTDTLYGDFDGDGRREFIWVQNPHVAMDRYDCNGPCDCLLRSSDRTMVPITTSDCIGGALINYGDLNGDGGDEVGMIPAWFTSCWGRHFLFTLRDHKWIEAIHGTTLRCESYDDTTIVRRDPRRKGYVIVKYYDIDSGFEKILEKSVKMR
ncbi:MAG: hypothetical protein JST83_12420 [Bacteroidetes bacterium]|nr:hypothetical protein [Bacteroidota bacterium]